MYSPSINHLSACLLAVVSVTAATEEDFGTKEGVFVRLKDAPGGDGKAGGKAGGSAGGLPACKMSANNFILRPRAAAGVKTAASRNSKGSNKSIQIPQK